MIHGTRNATPVASVIGILTIAFELRLYAVPKVASHRRWQLLRNGRITVGRRRRSRKGKERECYGVKWMWRFQGGNEQGSSIRRRDTQPAAFCGSLSVLRGMTARAWGLRLVTVVTGCSIAVLIPLAFLSFTLTVPPQMMFFKWLLFIR